MVECSLLLLQKEGNVLLMTYIYGYLAWLPSITAVGCSLCLILLIVLSTEIKTRSLQHDWPSEQYAQYCVCVCVCVPNTECPKCRQFPKISGSINYPLTLQVNSMTDKYCYYVCVLASVQTVGEYCSWTARFLQSLTSQFVVKVGQCSLCVPVCE